MKTSKSKSAKLQTKPETNKTALSANEIEQRFDDELKRRYWSEKALLETLPELKNAALSYELNLAIEEHIKVTQHQIDRLLHIFDVLEERALGLRYETMETLLENARLTLSVTQGFSRDEAIIDACKAIMQHEIKVYEKMKGYAKILDKKLAMGYIDKAINEERDAIGIFNEIELQVIYAD